MAQLIVGPDFRLLMHIAIAPQFVLAFPPRNMKGKNCADQNFKVAGRYLAIRAS